VADRPADRHTDHAPPFVTIGRIYLHSTAIRPKNASLSTINPKVVFEVSWVIHSSFYYKFTVEFAGEQFCKYMNKKVDLSHTLYAPWHFPANEFAINFAHDMKKLSLHYIDSDFSNKKYQSDFKSESERILEIGQHFMKLYGQEYSGLFV